jgi:NhaP-type Na+/H+ or K+/H+ antiporter
LGNHADAFLLRDLRDNWLPVSTLVFVAVGLTTTAVAALVHWLLLDMASNPIAAKLDRTARKFILNHNPI